MKRNRKRGSSEIKGTMNVKLPWKSGMMNSANNTNNVVVEVIRVRARVSLTDVFTTSIGVRLRRRGKFSRMRSNRTMVSFRE